MKLGAGILLCFALWADDPVEQFEMQVRPVLAKNCYSCHTQSKLGGLRLDSRESILAGGNSGPAVVPGNPNQSLLWQAITQTHERLKMPPSGKLKAEEIAAIEDWIRLGAMWPASAPKPKEAAYVITPEQRAFWAFQAVRHPDPPPVKRSDWVRSPIDRFILARLEEKGIEPAPAADKRTLVRRASFDLTGLPPSPEEVDAFLADKSPDAFAKVVDRLLASPHYGERWGRHWLDVARYSDDRLNSTEDDPYANAFRYRNWVIGAFNQDMPYDRFLKAQIAGDQLGDPDPLKYEAGLGFFALSPEFQDERVDALSRGLLAVTVACAQCHDHKFDPIPTKDYYALEGVFLSTELHETPLAPKEVVKRYQDQKKKIEKQEQRLQRFYAAQTDALGEMLASQTARYLLAVRDLRDGGGLEPECLKRWKDYLAEPRKDHPYLKPWYELTARNGSREEFEKEARRLEQQVLALVEEKREVDKKNEITLGLAPSRDDLASASLTSLERDKYIFWRDLFGKGSKDSAGFFTTPDGVYFFGKGKIERFLQGQWKVYAEEQQAELDILKKDLPEQYPFLHTIHDTAKPADTHIAIRGDRNNKGEIAQRAFLSVLSQGQPKPFTYGSGRLDLAEAITAKDNPLTPRVMANRIWLIHFGRGLVNTPGNFGILGDRPSHPELLDYLASEFVAGGWSIKALHRQIMLSSVYQESAARLGAGEAADPDNTLFWRANRRRMDVETMRDSLLAVSGLLDAAPGDKPAKLDETNRKRTVYGFISRRKTDPMLSLFDFPNPNATNEKRITTGTPPQRLFFMNSPFVETQAKALADRLKGDDASRLTQVYRLVYDRAPDKEETRAGLEFLRQGTWVQYSRVLLSSSEFLFVD
jgi:hypothetical protein